MATSTSSSSSKTSKSRYLPIQDHYVSESPASTARFIDTHCHVSTTLSMALEKVSARDNGNSTGGGVTDEVDLMNLLFQPQVEAIVDVYCDIPVSNKWKLLSDIFHEDTKLLRNWKGDYFFTMGCHPHSAKYYNPQVEADMLEAWTHPRCVAIGECGLDYKKSQSPHDVQRQVFKRQIEIATQIINKPLVVHTREAEEDTIKILVENLPRNHPVHVHCFTDSAWMGREILDYFPNSMIGITGVITFQSLKTTTALLQQSGRQILNRILLETDSPFMIPSNFQRNKKPQYAVSHSGMIPFTAQKVADLVGDGVTAEEVLSITRENARKLYNI
ncbi:TatD family [Lipomyces japonicus]|uniref:TatD family n=1 Tax=Lipomyces japonicus TaxID=56871 RepID=UPI0034CE8A74